MKKFTTMAAFAALMMFVSCGTTKQATVSSPDGSVHLEEEPCINYAEAKPVKRAYGVGTHFKESTARNIAEAQARAALARAINTQITTATEEYANNAELFSTNLEESAAISDQASSMNDKVLAISREVVSGAIVVKTSRYLTKDKQYKIYVCVEYNESAKKAAAKVAKQYQERMSAEQKEKIAFDEFRFEQKLAEQLEKYLQ